MKLRSRNETISPWALRPTLRAEVLRPETISDVTSQVHDLGAEQHILPRGAGTAYGDACVNAGGYQISTLRLNKILAFDAATGEMTCQAGVTLRDVIDAALPTGWFLGVSPGTMNATVGGSLACDVHGKNHHIAGAFSACVRAADVLTADGTIRTGSAFREPELFWATAGGLGQTGLVTQLTLQLRRVETAYLKSRSFTTRDLDDSFAQIESHPDAHYSVCWIDSLATGKELGRGALLLAEHATREEVAVGGPALQGDAASQTRNPRWSLPLFPPRICSSGAAWRAFNALFYRGKKRRAQQHPHGELEHFQKFFYPLDGVAHWNRAYGRQGFLEYQFAAPLAGARDLCRDVLSQLAGAGYGSFLAVLKRFGPRNPGPLSFPIEGYTLAVDMRSGGPAQSALLKRLDYRIADAGGRVYLVKDSRLDPGVVDAMYPERRAWAQFVNELDPQGKFTSNLVRRLGLRA